VIACAALACAAALAACGDDPAMPIPDDVARHAADPAAYVKPLGAAVAPKPAQEDDAYVRDLVSTFTSVTPENAMKWEIIEPSDGDFHFGEADAVVAAARRTHKRVRGHPLVWDQQLPDWVAKAGAAEAVLRRHVRTLVGRYRGRVATWDVVNEPLEDDGSLTPTPFTKAMGERFIDVAFEEAHKADPKAALFLNEIAAERGPKLDALVALAKRLQQRGVPIDGIGLQNHTSTHDPPTRAELARAMRRFADLGLQAEITEMDVAGGDPAAQAAAYAAAAQACAAASACTGLTVWGVTDRWSWLGEDKHPLLFDSKGRPKPALAAVEDALRSGG
jgi:endo-1,4-beta-xylanase